MYSKRYSETSVFERFVSRTFFLEKVTEIEKSYFLNKNMQFYKIKIDFRMNRGNSNT